MQYPNTQAALHHSWTSAISVVSRGRTTSPKRIRVGVERNLSKAGRLNYVSTWVRVGDARRRPPGITSCYVTDFKCFRLKLSTLSDFSTPSSDRGARVAAYWCSEVKFRSLGISV
ncbi:hypothetical protein EVAR_93638_1 [Eumeta japonica]|uniref:Uncharacterized protein n=1 Tax=Eumeta variegata TaxID=151549 RepID=A0A4C1TQL8_EUMVA|nr:hypothetical protein EVAR_93638_1 [Eumeta japonica]